MIYSFVDLRLRYRNISDDTLLEMIEKEFENRFLSFLT